MTDIDRIRALAAQHISYHGVTATIGRPLTDAEKTEYFRTRTVAKLRAAKERAAKATAAAVLLGSLLLLILPDLHGHADHIIALFLQKVCCHGGIHSPGHSYNHLFLH